MLVFENNPFENPVPEEFMLAVPPAPTAGLLPKILAVAFCTGAVADVVGAKGDKDAAGVVPLARLAAPLDEKIPEDAPLLEGRANGD